MTGATGATGATVDTRIIDEKTSETGTTEDKRTVDNTTSEGDEMGSADNSTLDVTEEVSDKIVTGATVERGPGALDVFITVKIPVERIVLPSQSEHGIVTIVVASMVSVGHKDPESAKLVVTGVISILVTGVISTLVTEVLSILATGVIAILLTTSEDTVVTSTTEEDIIGKLLITGLTTAEEVSDVLGHFVVVVYVKTCVMVTGET